MMRVALGAWSCSARMHPAAGMGEAAPTPTVSPSRTSREMTTAIISSGVKAVTWSAIYFLPPPCFHASHPLQVFLVVLYPYHLPLQITFKGFFVLRGFDVFLQM